MQEHVKGQSDRKVWLLVHKSGLAMAKLLEGHTLGSSVVENSNSEGRHFVMIGILLLRKCLVQRRN